MRFFGSVLAAVCALLLASCVDEFQSAGLSGNSLGASSSSPTNADETGLSKHDVALRFLTAFIRLDRNMALRYATPEAVAKFDWNVPHQGNIPYYDDKMILYFRGGWARVYFQDFGNTYKISNFDVHRR